MREKKKKVRTSITIDPDLLADTRVEAAKAEQSVSAYIETAVRHWLSGKNTVEAPVTLGDSNV